MLRDFHNKYLNTSIRYHAKVVKMGIYNLLQNYAESFELTEKLGKAIEKNKDDKEYSLEDILGKSKQFAKRLIQLHEKKLKGKRVQMHDIKNYWSEQEVKELEQTLDALDCGRSSLYYGGLKCSVEKSIIYRAKGKLYTSPITRRQVILDSFTAGGAFSLSSYFGYAFRMPIGYIVAVTHIVTAVCIGSSLSTNANEEPFKGLASELEKRANYIQETMKKYNLNRV